MSQQKSECTYSSCGEEPLKSSRGRYCIYHAKAEDKNEKEFKEALKKYITKIKAKDLDYNFDGFIFAGDIYFERDFGINVFRNSNFWGTNFERVAVFVGTNFEGEAFFQGTNSQGGAYFEGGHFHGEASFGEAGFQGETDFFEVTFQESLYFFEAIKVDPIVKTLICHT